MFEETPLFTLLRLLVMQLLGWQIYLFSDSMGSPRHPKGTNVRKSLHTVQRLFLTRLQHFLPSSSLFKPKERKGIVASDLGILTMSYVLYVWSTRIGLSNFVKLYFIPYIVRGYLVFLVSF
jgi:omega-6 fatty acid desaturase (delta-12 desaturase)